MVDAWRPIQSEVSELPIYTELSQTVRDEWPNLVQTAEQWATVHNQLLLQPEALSYENTFSFTGAVMMKPGELAALAPSPLKNFIFQPSQYLPDRYRYQVEYGNEKTAYGRAEAFYSSLIGSEEPQAKFELLTNIYQELLSDYPAIQKYLETKQLTQTEWRVALVFFDHLQSVQLQLFHLYSYLKTVVNPQSAEFSNGENEYLRQRLQETTTALYDVLSLQRPLHFTFETSVLENIVEKIQKTLQEAASPLMAKAVRDFREADHPLYNYVYALRAAERIETLRENELIFMGIHYGGIELPYVVGYVLQRAHSSIMIDYASLHYSNYSNLQLHSVDAFNLDQIMDRPLIIQGKTVALFDDGVLTGKSLQQLAHLIENEGGRVHFSVAAFAGSRRMGQMEETGGIDSQFLTQELAPDLVRVSPFARANTLEQHHANIENYSFNLVFKRVKSMMKGVSRW